MTLRKLIFWIHLIAGIAAGLVILIMSFTGVLLAYEKQIVSWADRSLLGEAPPSDAKRLPLQTLVDTAKEAGGAAPTTLTFYSDHRAISAVAGGCTVYVDAYSGEAIGIGSAGIREFFRSVTSWHRYIALSGDNRATGKSITGAANLVFMAIVLAGLFLWIPRGKWNWKSVRNVTWFKTNLNSKARNFNWHNVFGFWAAIPLFLIVLSGSVISYPWASNLVYQLTGTKPPAQNRGGEGGGRGQERNRNAGASTNLASIDPLVPIAESQVADWKTIRLQLPTSDKGPVSFAIDRGNGGKPQLRSTLTMDRVTGGVVTWETFESQDAGRRARSWLRFVHTGEFYGIAGQSIAAIASFAACMLVWTGFALSWRRFAAWVSNRKLKIAARDIQSPIDGTDAA
jgi:uncharacterized iron-regulated membrane protein